MESRIPRERTMHEIALAAGVSVTTVSHALSGKRPVSAETAARIRRLIDEYDYVPNSSAIRLQSGRSRMIALAVPDISHPYFGRIARGVEEAADQRDFGLVVCSTGDANPRLEQRYVNMLRARAADGLIYAASRSGHDMPQLTDMRSTVPLVFADEALEAMPGVSSVSSTLSDGARIASEHLRSHGHQSAVVIAGPAHLPSTAERVAGFRSVFANALTLHGDFGHQSGYDLISDLLAHGVRFTAVFAHNDYMALGAMRRLREAGLSVPGDVSVVGFDDLDVATLSAPGLTTIRKDLVETGRRAADLLLDQLEHEPAHRVTRQSQRIVLPVQLMVRESTGPAPPPSAR